MMFNNGFGNGYGCSFGLLNSFWGIGIGILVVALIVYFLIKSRQLSNGNHSAIQTLEVKFASGELSEEEYLQRRRVLNNK